MKKYIILAIALLVGAVNSATLAESLPSVSTTTTTTTTTSTSNGPEQLLGDVVVLPGVTSQGARRAQMLKYVQFARVSVSGMGVEYGPNTSVVITGTSPNDTLDRVAKYKINFKVSNPKDIVYFNVSLMMQGANGQEFEMFYGSAPVSVQEDTAGNLYVIQPVLKMWPNSRSAIFVGNDVTSVTIYYYDANGFQWTDEMNVYNGYVFFDEQYSGQLGRIVMWKKDNTSKLIDIKTGREIITQAVAGSISAFLDNYMESNDNMLSDPIVGNPTRLNVIEQITPSSDSASAPVLMVELRKGRDIAIFGSVIANGLAKYQPTIMAQGPSGQFVKAILYTDGSYVIPANEAGRWWISFEYPKGSGLFGVDDVPNYPYYYYGGGKG